MYPGHARQPSEARFLRGNLSDGLWTMHVRQPVQDGEHPLKVITDGAMCHPIVVHNLDAPQLVVRGVYFPPEDLEKQAREKTFIPSERKARSVL